MKRSLSIRVENYTYEIINSFANKNNITISELLRISLEQYIFKHQKDTNNPEIKQYIQYMKMENARKNTRLQMRKATFISNVKRKITKLINDGLSKQEFNKLIEVWCVEAEANGIDKENFLNYIIGHLKSISGGGIYEVDIFKKSS